MSSQADIPAADKSDSSQAESSSPRHAKGGDATAATGVIAGPAAGDGLESLPIVPPSGANPAPSQTVVPTITGLDTVAGPETVAAASGDGALSGVATGDDTLHGGVRSPAAPPKAEDADGGAPAHGDAGAVSVERLPTRLSVNKARHAASAQTGMFRMGDLHSDAHPTPDNSHMLGICAWGTALALAGVGVGIRGLAAIIGGSAPGWYKPALIGVGVIGVLLTVGAFVTIQRRYLPWLLLAFATLPLAVTIALTIIAL
ncbi:hypothetical protein [Asanoa iriomotensis]|uniref:Uncharacterized protein n=1 Tax=Asanoa iriomotensis TaxID=234613 RepID=A0ABQ4BW15_9ACTN|nr:hypothetical protein [Asanoa iriomotensis]GIF54727.1 hypothetical protein Air01nite_08220 [Asanoa iriomotensis]